MYLTQVEINRDNRQKYRDLDHLGSYHRWVERSFPQEFEDNQRTRKLWRKDTLNEKEYLLIVSEIEPDKECLEEYGVEHSAKTLNYEQFLETLNEKNTYRFKVELNPVRRFDGREKAHTTVEHQLRYLTERQEQKGFKVIKDTVGISSRGVKPLKKKNQQELSVVYAVYEGLLKITDLEKFKQTLTKGFGRKKSYGFGMMTVIPINESE